jgi:hypothetical protein
MLKSQSAIATKADLLIAEYMVFKDVDVPKQTDTRNGPRYVYELRNLALRAKGFAERAREIMSDAPAFNALAPLVQEDVIAIAEESEIAVVELDDEVEPDKKWAKLSRDTKAKATDRLLADEAALVTAKARLRGERRGFTPPKGPKP